MSSRIFLHISFWVIYTLIYALLNTSFAPPSDMTYSIGIRFLRFWVGEIMMLPVKMATAYLFIYWLVPKYLLKRQYKSLLLGTIFLLIPAILINRLTNYYLLYPLFYDSYPPYELFSSKRFLYALMDTLPAVAIVVAIKFVRSRLEGQQREAALEKEKLQSELNFLKAQTNPHFLFNTLNNIYALARKNSSQTAPVVMKLSKLLRFMLYECSQPRIPVSKEIQVIEDYLDLERLRYNDRLKVNFTKDLGNNSLEISPLLLLPFVENAFKHGSSNTRFDTIIDIYLKTEKQHITFFVRNEKEGHTENNPIGIGLANVQRQLALLYPNRHELHLKDEGAFYEVLLKIKVL